MTIPFTNAVHISNAVKRLAQEHPASKQQTQDSSPLLSISKACEKSPRYNPLLPFMVTSLSLSFLFQKMRGWS